MGWTGIFPTHFTLRGQINRKAECDAYFLEGLNRGHYDVVASTMVGSTYYAAVKHLKRAACDGDGKIIRTPNGNLIYEDIPVEEQATYAVVILTQTEKGMFYYKEMSETCGPAQRECPASILKKLSPIESEWANEWRKHCWERANKLEMARKMHTDLSSLPIGSVIRFNYCGQDTWLQKCAPNHQFKTAWWKVDGEAKYFSKKRIPDDYEIIKVGGQKK